MKKFFLLFIILFFQKISFALEYNIDSVRNIYKSCDLENKGLKFDIFNIAMKGYCKLEKEGRFLKPGILTIVDFSQRSGFKRYYVIDLNKKLLLFNTYAAHGKGSDPKHTGMAKYFSNVPESNKSSLGFYRTGEIDSLHIYGHKTDMMMYGLEKGINDKAFRRKIVTHEAWYVNDKLALDGKGIIGRSLGCPALPEEMTVEITDIIKGGTCLFIWGKDSRYLVKSKYDN